MKNRKTFLLVIGIILLIVIAGIYLYIRQENTELHPLVFNLGGETVLTASYPGKYVLMTGSFGNSPIINGDNGESIRLYGKDYKFCWDQAEFLEIDISKAKPGDYTSIEEYLENNSAPLTPTNIPPTYLKKTTENYFKTTEIGGIEFIEFDRKDTGKVEKVFLHFTKDANIKIVATVTSRSHCMERKYPLQEDLNNFLESIKLKGSLLN